MRLQQLLLAAMLTAVTTFALAESGTVTRATQLVAAPYSDAASRGVLRVEQQVEIIERQGGWYQVTADDGRTGWLRLSSIRLGAAEQEESGGGFWASVFSFTGRSQARTASATTGIRGLSEEEIRDAEPDAHAVERLADFHPDASEAKSFAAAIKLKTNNIEPLPEKAPRKGGGK